MQSEIVELVVVGLNSVLLDERDARVILPVLVRDAMDNPAYPSGLIETVRAGDPIDLARPRPMAAAEHDRQAPTVAGYLSGLIRDRLELGLIADFQEFVALGFLASDVEAATA
jgi:hypothetical protein